VFLKITAHPTSQSRFHDDRPRVSKKKLLIKNGFYFAFFIGFYGLEIEIKSNQIKRLKFLYYFFLRFRRRKF